MTRGLVSVELYTPNLDELRSKAFDELAASKGTEFVTLNTSHENFSFCCSVIDHGLARPVSIPKYPGPRRGAEDSVSNLDWLHTLTAIHLSNQAEKPDK